MGKRKDYKMFKEFLDRADIRYRTIKHYRSGTIQVDVGLDDFGTPEDDVILADCYTGLFDETIIAPALTVIFHRNGRFKHFRVHGIDPKMKGFVVPKLIKKKSIIAQFYEMTNKLNIWNDKIWSRGKLEKLEWRYKKKRVRAKTYEF